MYKWIGIIAVAAGVLLGCSSNEAPKTYREKIIQHRKDKNREFSNTDHSPLEEGDIPKFAGLNYFPVDSNYRVVAEFIAIDTAQPFQMPTTTDRLPVYVKRGIARFEINGNPCELSVYQNLDNEEDTTLFVPFADATSALETYGGGRYLDVSPTGKTIELDFNLAYNPYCAYNHKYSCPIPPRENLLTVAINAGEKVFKKY